MARLRATYFWREEKGKIQLGMKMRTGKRERSRGRVRDSGLISHKKYTKTATTCRVALAEIDLGTKRVALLQPKKRQIHMESGRKGGKGTHWGTQKMKGYQRTGIPPWGVRCSSHFSPGVQHLKTTGLT